MAYNACTCMCKDNMALKTKSCVTMNELITVIMIKDITSILSQGLFFHLKIIYSTETVRKPQLLKAAFPTGLYLLCRAVNCT